MRKMKKHKGNILGEAMIGCMILITTIILMISYIQSEAAIAKKEDVKQIARDYIIRMETEGYLSAAAGNDLQQELQAQGVTILDMSGTSFSEVGYGNPVYLCFTYKISTGALNTGGSSFFAFFFEQEDYQLSVNLKSTAKY